MKKRYMPIVVWYYEDGMHDTIYRREYHKNPGKSVNSLLRAYLHELRIDNFKYRSYTINVGCNTVIAITGYRGKFGKTVMVNVVRKSGVDIFSGKTTFKTDTVLDELW